MMVMTKLLNILIGCLISSVGILILRHSHLITGGVPGLALSLSYQLGTTFSIIYMGVSIPFYILSIMRMGWDFTLSTLLATIMLSCLTALDEYIPAYIVPDWFGAVFGGGFVGVGLAYLFWNGSSLGGVNILVLYLHKKFNWDPGRTTFFIDSAITILGFCIVGLWKGFYSLLSVVIVSTILSYFKGKIAAANETKPTAVAEQ